MSDETKTDAEVIAVAKEALRQMDISMLLPGPTWTFAQAMEYVAPVMLRHVSQSEVHRAMLRTIDRLTAERDQAREQLAKLEEVCEEYFDVKDALAERSRYGIDSAWYGSMSDAVGKAENAIRAALGIESEAGE